MKSAAEKPFSPRKNEEIFNKGFLMRDKYAIIYTGSSV